MLAKPSSWDKLNIKYRTRKVGQTAGVLSAFESLATPIGFIARSPGLEESRPAPLASLWQGLQAADLVCLRVCLSAIHVGAVQRPA